MQKKIKEKYASLPEVVAYLEAVKDDAVQHNRVFIGGDEEGQQPDLPALERASRLKDQFFLRRVTQLLLGNRPTDLSSM